MFTEHCSEKIESRYLVVKAFLASVSSGLGAKPVGETSAKYEAEEVEVGVGTDELELAGKLEGTD